MPPGRCADPVADQHRLPDRRLAQGRKPLAQRNRARIFATDRRHPPVRDAGFITHSVVLTELLTYGTLASELALGVLLWNAAARPWVILIGLALHLSIDYWILVGFFSYAMFSGYVAFTKPETAIRWTLRARDRLRLRRAASVGADVTPTQRTLDFPVEVDIPRPGGVQPFFSCLGVGCPCSRSCRIGRQRKRLSASAGRWRLVPVRRRCRTAGRCSRRCLSRCIVRCR